jgi:hypothetical protein
LEEGREEEVIMKSTNMPLKERKESEGKEEESMISTLFLKTKLRNKRILTVIDGVWNQQLRLKFKRGLQYG